MLYSELREPMRRCKGLNRKILGMFNNDRLHKHSYELTKYDGHLDDSIINLAMTAAIDYHQIIPFWMIDHGAKIRPHIFKGKLSRARRKKLS